MWVCKCLLRNPSVSLRLTAPFTQGSLRGVQFDGADKIWQHSKCTALLLIRLAARATFPTWGRLFSAHRTLSRAPGNSKKGSQPLLGRSEVRQGEISSSQAPCPSPRRKRQVSLIALLVLSKLCPLRWDTIWFFSLGCLSLHHQRRCRKPFAPLARYGFGSL